MEKKYEALQKYIVSLRRKFHRIPELGKELPKTKELVCEELERIGIPYECSEKDSGILATIQGKYPGKVIALRADMDGLAMHERRKCPMLLYMKG